ncbi:MAG: hypothetical protein M8353_07985 [ANME-2 cluster archaeon]|nr:hypothetical protein [ANME-2 cluster archaeon]
MCVIEEKSDPDLVKLICSSCEFFKEDDIDLECSAFKILKDLINSGKISLQEVSDATK